MNQPVKLTLSIEQVNLTLEALGQMLINQWIRFGNHHIRGADVVFDQVSQPDVFDAGVAIGDTAELVFLLEPPQAGQYIIIEFDLLACREASGPSLRVRLRASSTRQ